MIHILIAQLLAQAATSAGFDLGSLTNVGAGAAIAIIFAYVVTKGIPQIIERFTSEQEKARTAYLSDQKEARETFVKEIAATREQARSEGQAQRAEFREALSQVVEHCREETREYREFATKKQGIV